MNQALAIKLAVVAGVAGALWFLYARSSKKNPCAGVADLEHCGVNSICFKGVCMPIIKWKGIDVEIGGPVGADDPGGPITSPNDPRLNGL